MGECGTPPARVALLVDGRVEVRRPGVRLGKRLRAPAFGALRWCGRVVGGRGLVARRRLVARLGLGLDERLRPPAFGAQRRSRVGLRLGYRDRLGRVHGFDSPIRLHHHVPPRRGNVGAPGVGVGHPEPLGVVIVVDPALPGVEVRGWIPLGVVVGVHAGGPAAGAHHPIVRPAGQAHLVDVGVAALAPVGDRVVHLAAVRGYGAAGFRAAAVAQDDGEPLSGRRGPAGPEEVQHLARDVVEHPEIAVGIVLGGQPHQVLDRHGPTAAGAGGPGHGHQVLQGGRTRIEVGRPLRRPSSPLSSARRPMKYAASC